MLLGLSESGLDAHEQVLLRGAPQRVPSVNVGSIVSARPESSADSRPPSVVERRSLSWLCLSVADPRRQEEFQPPVLWRRCIDHVCEAQWCLFPHLNQDIRAERRTLRERSEISQRVRRRDRYTGIDVDTFFYHGCAAAQIAIDFTSYAVWSGAYRDRIAADVLQITADLLEFWSGYRGRHFVA